MSAEYQAPTSSAGRRQFVARTLASRLFKRSPRQRELLDYLCRKAFDEPEVELREQDIGTALFGRPASYDTSQDNIVRVSASELRRKLEEHFRTEGSAEPFVLELPRGGYTPVIRPRHELESASDPRALRRLRFALAALTVLSLALGATVFFLYQRLPARLQPESALWRQFFSSRQETDIVIADSSVSLLSDTIGRPISLQDYIARTYLLDAVAAEKNPDHRHMMELLMSRRYTSVSDVLTVQRIAHREVADGKSATVYYAREYPSQRLQTMNAILLGSKRSNPWVEAFEPQMNFHVEHDAASGVNSVHNVKPRPGEPSAFIAGGGFENGESLAVVAYLWNARHTAEAIILAGTGAVGTAAAGEAFLSQQGFARILATLPPSSKVPHFEAVLKARSAGATVQDFEVLATRLLP